MLRFLEKQKEDIKIETPFNQFRIISKDVARFDGGGDIRRHREDEEPWTEVGDDNVAIGPHNSERTMGRLIVLSIACWAGRVLAGRGGGEKG